jgi:hypothetical protein
LAYWTGILRCDDDERHDHLELLIGVPPPGAEPARDPGDDRGEDEQRDAVADAALGHELTQPHEQDRARGERQDDDEHLAEVEVGDQLHPGGLLEGAEQEHVADRLRERETDGQVARVLGDPLLSDLTLLGELLQRGHRDLQDLQDDRSGDERHDAEREQRDPAQASTGEQVQQPEHAVAAQLGGDRRDRLGVDPRGRDVRPQAVEREHHGGERDLLADVRDPERSEDRRDHETAVRSLLDDLAGTAGSLDGLSRRATEGVSVHGERLGDLALGEHLDRNLLAGRQTRALERLDGDDVAGHESLLEVGEVHRLRVRPEWLKGHRLLHVRTTQLAHPHVDRHLATLERRAALGARA